MAEKSTIRHYFDQLAPNRSYWFRRNWFYHQQIVQVCSPFLNPDSRVLELGCSTGDLLQALNPGYGVGVDFSAASINIAQQLYPDLNWLVADVEFLPEEPPLDKAFDLVVMADLVGYLDDIELTFRHLHTLLHDHSRVVISLWNWMWQPVLQAAEALHLKAPDLTIRQQWVSALVVRDMLELAGYEVVQTSSRLLFPYHLPGITPFINSFSQAPVLNRLALLQTLVARPLKQPPEVHDTSVTVVIPTRNEVGNISHLIERMPEMGTHTELLFVDGLSSDGTIDKIYELIAAYPDRDIKFMSQVGTQSSCADRPPDLMLSLGKGDAVRKGFEAASGDILMILDSDLSVPPEELSRFYDALLTGKARLANGTRFVYQQEKGAMPHFNRAGNLFFSLLFSWLLDQMITDTLCGTKALFKHDYNAIAANRAYFGDFDPFGDFDLLFGAAWLNLRILDIPIHYRARTYGDSKVRASVHGHLLLRMSLIGLWQFKIRPLLPNIHRPASQKAPPDHRGCLLVLVMVIGWLARRRKRSGG
jgi:glycosyltransferase involved in cell wall biosynthesis/SAM-dependent methyltransferase